MMRTALKITIILLSILTGTKDLNAQDFQGKAYYFKKTSLELGSWGARMSEQQKKQIAERLKNRLEKTYVLTFNKEASTYKEIEQLDAISGATDSWGKNFSPGLIYKNIKTNQLVQNQEFYGKQFLVKDSLQEIKWTMTGDTKKVGNYMCFKATAQIPSSDLEWWSFSWNSITSSNNNEDTENDNEETSFSEVIAWYTPQIPVGHGPLEYYGLPGLILEVSAGNTVMLCSKLIINPEDKDQIEAPDKGKEVTKEEYKTTVIAKMKEFRENRMGRRPRG
ncbi:GLPGLI family protein [Gaetbulibacter sp. M240]|uniref:GLPGLI family protein n=1 Tax=Gaetbulibacter sp. M240 TaxID=3126511 RepID=UPI00374F5041